MESEEAQGTPVESETEAVPHPSELQEITVEV
jgi:hypothetical protein